MYKKIIFIVFFLIIIIPKISTADTFSLRSSSKTVEPNKTFTLSVYVIPSNSSVYTAQANISFPTDLVSVESFTYASSWFPMNQSGYDLIDNTSGKLIKTAGYPNGFNKETLLGTLILKSKKAGLISISINKESFILDMDSNNVLNSYGSFSITSSSPVYVPPVVKPIVPPVIKPVVPPVVNPNSQPVVEIVAPTPEIQENVSNEYIYKKNLVASLIFLFTGASLIDDIIINSFGFN
jgi:hypothetical protein